MPNPTIPPDPRPDLAAAHAWVAGLIAAVGPDSVGAPTPCTEWSVQQLLGHIVAGTRRAAAIGRGEAADSVPLLLREVPDNDWAAAFAGAREEVQRSWASDTMLDTEYTHPAGRLPGRVILATYVIEALAHGWDLARATGEDPEAPTDLAERALGYCESTHPAGPRAMMPFDAPLPVDTSAGPTTRLVGWLGRDVSWPG